MSERKLVRSTSRPTRRAAKVGDDLWTVDADDTLVGGGRVLKGNEARDAFPKRFDLPRNNPLYGKRAATEGPAGSRDTVVDETGRVTTGREAAPIAIDE